MATMDVLLAPRTGLRLQSPVMTASGTFGYGVEFAARMSLSGLGAVVCKGTTLRPRTGNSPVRMRETAAGMLNSIGLQNVGVDAVVRDKAPIWAGWDVPIFVNVSGSSIDEYVTIISRLDSVKGVAGIELNISCPNVKEGGVTFGTDARRAGEVTARVREVTDLPLLIKLSPNVADIRPIAAAVELAGADAISLINTFYGMQIDVEKRAPALSNISGGLSGPAIKPLALYLVYQVAQVVQIPIIGIGGIMTSGDALEFMLAGASAIQVGTALLLDPTCWRAVVSGIQDWCTQSGVQDLAEIVGSANREFRPPAQIQRAEGLKAFGTK